MKQDKLSTIILTAYVSVCTILFHIATPFDITKSTFLLSPILILALVFTIVKYGNFTKSESSNKTTWDYSDKENYN